MAEPAVTELRKAAAHGFKAGGELSIAHTVHQHKEGGERIFFRAGLFVFEHDGDGRAE